MLFSYCFYRLYLYKLILISIYYFRVLTIIALIFSNSICIVNYRYIQ